MKYKIIYHLGDEIDVKTKTMNGHATLTPQNFEISGSSNVTISVGEINNVELFRLHGLGRMLKIEYGNHTIFLTVVRFCLFNFFALIDFSKTGRLRDELNKVLSGSN